MRQPFNGDVWLQQHFAQLIKDNRFDLILETGTYHGETTEFFASFGLPVITTEVNPEHTKIAQSRVTEGVVNVITWITGDSEKCIRENINLFKDKNFIAFLDSHWNSDKVLERELELFAEFAMKPYILIHDFYNPNFPNYGYDTWDGHRYDFTFYKPYFDKIYGEDGYEYYYNQGATGAKRGVIFVHSK
jgi:cephalosporin hydroxylase